MESNKEPQEGRDEKGRFVRGNLFSTGLQTSGRPPIYSTHEEIAAKLDEYIAYEDYMRGNGKGKGIYTMEGAALYLGFATRQSMYDNEKRDAEFSYIMLRFRSFLTDWNVKKLYWGGTMPGAMFWLKNHGGYTDEVIQHQKQEISHVEIVEKKRED